MPDDAFMKPACYRRFLFLLPAMVLLAGSITLPTVHADDTAFHRLPGRDAAMVAREHAIKKREREQWPQEVMLRGITPKLDRFFANLQAAAASPAMPVAEASAALYHPAFTGTPAPQPGNVRVDVQEANGVRLQSFVTGAEQVVPAAAFKRAWAGYVAGYRRINRTEYQISSISASLKPAVSATLRVHFRLTGETASERREDQGTFEVVFYREPDSSAWRMHDFRLEHLDRVTGSAQFSDDSAQFGEHESPAAASHFVAYFSQGISLADFDNDGDLDLFFPQRDAPAIAYRNDGSGQFEEATAALGLEGLTGVRSAYFFDWDNDDDLDLLVLSAQRLFLFERRKKGFVDVSAASGFDRLQTSGLIGAAVADFNRDGLLDFYVCNYGDPNNGPGLDYFDSRKGFINKLFQNAGGGKFTDATDAAGLGADNRRWTFAALWLDYDRDGEMDLYVVNDYGPNQLFHNTGDGHFEEVAASVGAQDYGNGMGASWADYNNDGYLDLYVSNMHSEAGWRVLNSPDYRGSRQQR
ncbi:MAG TPA: VCBS repeat-containing protein, partial [Thiotrichales bacterium]|nr:VCBS repeat-containing protein [Thiotrichales bacterium]